MSGRPSPFVSMSAALSMPFDELSDLVRNGSSNPSAIRPDQVHGGSTSAVAASTSYRDSVPKASQELVVYVSTDNQRKRETIKALLRKQKGGNESIRVLDLKQVGTHTERERERERERESFGGARRYLLTWFTYVCVLGTVYVRAEEARAQGQRGLYPFR